MQNQDLDEKFDGGERGEERYYNNCLDVTLKMQKTNHTENKIY
tara:strand:- start:502 stop:630 length:129 start_codon:yes stop_codon:yes gene_type:complete